MENAGTCNVKNLSIKDISIEMDFFEINRAIKPSEVEKQNDLVNMAIDESRIKMTAKLEIGGKTLQDGTTKYPGCVSASTDVQMKKDLTVNMLHVHESHAIYDMCFELPISDKELKALEENPVHNRQVIGWAWVISDYTKKAYKDGFWASNSKVDISDRKSRIEFLNKVPLSKIYPDNSLRPKASSNAPINENENPKRDENDHSRYKTLTDKIIIKKASIRIKT